MKRRAVFVPIILLIGVLLSGCGLLTLTSQRMQVALEPTGNLGYTVDTSGVITIQQNAIRFRNSAGANGVYLTGFQIAYFDSAGNEQSPSVVGNLPEQTMSLFVPPGIQCAEPDAVRGCTILSDGAVIAPGPEVVTTETYMLLTGGIAERHIDEAVVTGYFPTDWYAEITFVGMTNDGQPFETQPYKLWISPPS
ncbi:MAG: hypothetical protein WD314_16455 [Trueperaceae bacterium]